MNEINKGSEDQSFEFSLFKAYDYIITKYKLLLIYGVLGFILTLSFYFYQPARFIGEAKVHSQLTGKFTSVQSTNEEGISTLLPSSTTGIESNIVEDVYSYSFLTNTDESNLWPGAGESTITSIRNWMNLLNIQNEFIQSITPEIPQLQDKHHRVSQYDLPPKKIVFLTDFTNP